MNWLSSFMIANLIGIGSNLDNCGVGLAYGTKNITIQGWVNAVINGIGFGTTLLGTYSGSLISRYIPEAGAKWVACLVLCAIGIFSLYSAYLQPRMASRPAPSVKLSRPGLKQAVMLGLALSCTNIASGFSATVAHSASIWTTALSITGWGYIMIWLGNSVAIRFFSHLLGKYSSLAAGVLLIGVGIHQVI
ncbi:manganese efflux pump MntP [Alicyclobacillus kakegawensis]|uniref:manganese efflux pump MntP n=1 Tax=Alicyclobacillus kakegawensis TaxID=392012 RepID=UPI00083433B3|nr:manganese efflux pump [Alicyclobacillus kakegawensis]